MYLFFILIASAVVMYMIHLKSNEDDDDGPIWR